jgi:hypothetical protein
MLIKNKSFDNQVKLVSQSNHTGNGLIIFIFIFENNKIGIYQMVCSSDAPVTKLQYPP